jgi:hypothetical protein
LRRAFGDEFSHLAAGHFMDYGFSIERKYRYLIHAHMVALFVPSYVCQDERKFEIEVEMIKI